jgi:glutamine synthetase
MDSIIKWLKGNKIQEVQCLTGDQNGISRGKILPVKKFIEDGGFRIAEGILLQATCGDLIDEAKLFNIIDPGDIDMILKPDPLCCYILPWIEKPTAMIIHDCFDQKNNSVELSPRNILKKVIKLYQDKGWQAIVAPEMELYLTENCTDPNLPLVPPKGKSGKPESGRQSFGIDAINEFSPLITDVYDWSKQQGLQVDVVVHEEGTAQLEFNFNHGDPLLLADQAFVFKRTMKEAAIKHGCTATFMAKPISGEPGSAMHIHQSIIDIKTGKNIFSDGNKMTDCFHHYIGGLQQFIPHVMPMFAPNINSFRRFITKQATPVNLHWGIENRTVGLRVPDAGGQARRVENRLPGSDANPYLAMAATLLCGYIGMVDKIAPSAETKGRANKTKSIDLPLSIEEAINKMANSDTIKEYLGSTFVEGYTETRIADYENFKKVISAWERDYLLTTV